MPVMTVSRQYGSLGDEIGNDVAGRLGLRLVDQDIITMVAKRLGVSPSSVTGHDERDTGLVSELVRTMRRLYPATIAPTPVESDEVDEAAYRQVIRQVIWEVAREDDAVIIGRGGPFVLESHPDVLHVLVIAPLNVRIERVMVEDGLNHEAALQRIKEVDAARGRYVRHFYRTNWLDVAHYDLVINTGHFSELHSTSLICSALASEPST